MSPVKRVLCRCCSAVRSLLTMRTGSSLRLRSQKSAFCPASREDRARLCWIENQQSLYGLNLTTQCLVLVLLLCRSGRLPAVYRRTGTSVARVQFPIRQFRRSGRDSNRVGLTLFALTQSATWTRRVLHHSVPAAPLRSRYRHSTGRHSHRARNQMDRNTRSTQRTNDATNRHHDATHQNHAPPARWVRGTHVPQP